jgi:hypothetical protein
MTEEMLDLARRLVACTHWRWMPGMMDTEGRRILDVYSSEVEVAPHGYDDRYVPITGLLPDLNDLATVGCVLGVIREAWDKPYLYIAGETKVEALVVALEAAP